MNRYSIVGVLRDMRAGRRVVVVAGTRAEARSAMTDVSQRLQPGERAVRGIGRERCESVEGGSIRFMTRTDLRGVSADVVVVVGHRPALDEAEDLRVLSTTGAEVIV